jgi:hypothetical protein
MTMLAHGLQHVKVIALADLNRAQHQSSRSPASVTRREGRI